METETNSLTDSVKPETSATDSQTASTEAATNADKPSSEPGTSTGNGEAEPGRANARIRDLVDQKNAANRAAQEAKSRETAANEKAEFYRRQLEDLKPVKVNEADHPDQFSRLRAEMRAERVEERRSDLQGLHQQAMMEAQQARDVAFRERANEFKDRAPDFDEAVYRHPSQGGPNISEMMAEAIREAENGPAIAYYLAKNPAESHRIASLSPVAQAAAIGRLEGKVTVPTPRTTQAPPPVKTASGGTGTAAFDPENSSPKEFEAEFMRRLYPNG